MDSTDLKKEVVTTAIERLLEKHNVPASQLLAALKKLESVIAEYHTLAATSAGEHDAHVQQMSEFGDTLERFSLMIDAHEENASQYMDLAHQMEGILKDHATQQQEHTERLAHFDETVTRILALTPKKGDPGKDAPAIDTTAIVTAVIEALRQDAPPQEEHESAPELDKDILFKEFIARIQKEKSIDVSHIRNGDSFLFNKTRYKFSELMSGHGSSTGTSGTQVFNEVVSGSAKAWALAHTPQTGTLRLFANGQRLTPTVDYTLTGANIVTVTSWASGTLIADYTY